VFVCSFFKGHGKRLDSHAHTRTDHVLCVAHTHTQQT